MTSKNCEKVKVVNEKDPPKYGVILYVLIKYCFNQNIILVNFCIS